MTASVDLEPPGAAARWSELTDAFFTDRIASRRGMSAATRAAYTADLVAWARLLGDSAGRPAGDDELARATVSDLTWHALRSVYPTLRQNSAASTCQRRVGTLRLFTRWLMLEGLLQADPMLRLESPRREDRPPVGWTVDELRRIADAVTSTVTGDLRRWAVRDWAIFSVLASTGCRAAELCSLSPNSFERDSTSEPTLRILGKGGKYRIVPVPAEALTAVDAYISAATGRFGAAPPSAPMFRLTSGKALKPSALNYLVSVWITAASVPKHAGEATHAFRHTFAKALIRQGVPAPTVQALLGHSDLKTTGIYVKATASDLRDAVDSSSIRTVLREAAPPTV